MHNICKVRGSNLGHLQKKKEEYMSSKKFNSTAKDNARKKKAKLHFLAPKF